MDDLLTCKYKKITSIISACNSLAIAFSGGVDSTLLARVSHDVLGERTLAITVDSEAYPPSAIDETRSLAALIGIRLIELPATICDIEEFASNAPDRCYHCKKALFTMMIEKAREIGFDTIADGSNVDDLADYRPGEKAIEELGVKSPLKEAGLTKSDIRALSKELGLPTWNRQSFACLASRFPYGTRITPEMLERIGRSEEVLRDLGFSRYRVRHHGDIARIEVSSSEIGRLIEPGIRDRISSALKNLGYTYVAVDLEGYRTGSMNEVLK